MNKIVCAGIDCEVCEREFFVPWHRRNKAKFCSQICYHRSDSFKGFQLGHKYGFHENVKKNWFKHKSDGWMYKGYRFFWDRKRGNVAEHRDVVERFLGRKLRTDEHVHHINGIRNDNRIENLQVLTRSQHSLIHTK